VSSEISVSDGGMWIRTRVGGLITKEAALEFIAEAAQKAKVRGLKSLLFDFRDASNTKNSLDDYEIAHHHLRRLGFSGFSKVAILVKAGDTSHKFFEVTSSNAGHPWTVFCDENAAQDWLRQD